MNTKRIIYILTVLFLMVQEASAYSWTGSGTSGSPYKISSAADWNELADSLSSYSGKYFKLTANISVSKMIRGTFTGTFDGDGKTLTVTIAITDANVVDVAPFQYIANGAVIKNLTVKGSVSSKTNYTAGLVGRTTAGICSIENCTVNVNLTLNGYGGGFISHADDATTTN